MEANILADVEETDGNELSVIDNFDPVAWNQFIASDWPFNKPGEIVESETDSKFTADVPIMSASDESDFKPTGDGFGNEPEQFVPSPSSPDLAPDVFKIPKKKSTLRTVPNMDKPLEIEVEAESVYSQMPEELFEPPSQWEVVPKSVCVIPPRVAMVDSEEQDSDSEEEGLLPSAKASKIINYADLFEEEKEKDMSKYKVALESGAVALLSWEVVRGRGRDVRGRGGRPWRGAGFPRGARGNRHETMPYRGGYRPIPRQDDRYASSAGDRFRNTGPSRDARDQGQRYQDHSRSTPQPGGSRSGESQIGRDNSEFRSLDRHSFDRRHYYEEEDRRRRRSRSPTASTLRMNHEYRPRDRDDELRRDRPLRSSPVRRHEERIGGYCHSRARSPSLSPIRKHQRSPERAMKHRRSRSPREDMKRGRDYRSQKDYRDCSFSYRDGDYKRSPATRY